MVFAREESANPQVITVVDGAEEMRSELRWAIMAHVSYAECGNGLPLPDEVSRLATLRKKLDRKLGAEGAEYVGHALGSGLMRVLYYGKKPVRGKVTVGLLRRVSVELEAFHDPDWQRYDLHLKPTAYEAEQARSGHVRRMLAKHGDRHDLPRDVDFGAVFPDPGSRAAFVEAVALHGFELSAQATWEDDCGRAWCEVTKSSSVEPAALDPLVALLAGLAEQHGGEFDGWACPVEKGR